jgi:WD40 repeat protein
MVKGDPADHNGLRVASFCPDSTQVAVASRNWPVDLWDLQSQTRINCYVIKTEEANEEDDVFLAPEAIQWHPDTGRLLILYQNTTMVDWNPINEEQTQHAIGAKSIVCSPCGNYLLASHHDGCVNVYAHPDYANDHVPKYRLIYHLEHHEFVRGLAFSPDGQRFYDLRGYVCSVWEPDALVKLDKTDEDDDNSSISSSVWTMKQADSSLANQPHITAIASGPNDFGFCCGREDGSLAIHDMDMGKKIRTLPGHT